MDPNNFIDTIKTEKANAISRYQTFTNIPKLFQTIELLIFVTLISWSSTHLPYVIKLSSQFVTSLSSYFNNQHIVFVVGNVIVVVCYILSRYSDSVNDAVNGNCNSNENCNFTHRKRSSADQMTSAKPSEIRIPVNLNNKTELQFAAKDNSNGNGNFTRRKTTSDGLMTSAKSPEIKIPAIKESKTESNVAGEMGIKADITRRYQRTKSENVRSENPVKADRELRRSVTEMRRSVAGSSGRGEAVEKMSNEEFRAAVEKFILKQQRFLKEQQKSMVEDEN